MADLYDGDKLLEDDDKEDELQVHAAAHSK